MRKTRFGISKARSVDASVELLAPLTLDGPVSLHLRYLTEMQIHPTPFRTSFRTPVLFLPPPFQRPFFRVLASF